MSREVPRPFLSQLRGLVSVLVTPGGNIRRWLLVAALGGAAVTFAVAYLIRGLTTVSLPDLLPGYWEALPLVFIGAATVLIAGLRLIRRLGELTAAARPDETIRQSIIRMQRQSRGPRIVALGGGTGLSTLLRGIKDVSPSVTGVVTVTDDGGSSGKLRQEFGVLPPGDIRNCIVALAEAEPLMKDLFQYRFTEGSLAGHSFGNLFIVAMTGLTGSFERAVGESSRVLKVAGSIVPSTLSDVDLVAVLEDGTEVTGESAIPRAGGRVSRIRLSAEDPEAYGPAVEAIADAQLIVMGPGSLYTSVIPNLLVPGIAAAIQAAPAPVVYVCNVATQPGETHGYTVADHVQAIRRHRPDVRIDYVLANNNMSALGESFPNSRLVLRGDFEFPGIGLVEADLMNMDFRGHHHPEKLAAALLGVYHKAVVESGRTASGPVRDAPPRRPVPPQLAAPAK
jgi:uncharacterized cofD-like protein